MKKKNEMGFCVVVYKSIIAKWEMRFKFYGKAVNECVKRNVSVDEIKDSHLKDYK